MDQQLVECLGQLDLSFEQTDNLVNKEIKFMDIEENPFYKPYDCTDLYLWKKESNSSQLKLKTLKMKHAIRKPILQRLHNQSQAAHVKNWLKQCKLDIESEVTWVNSLDIKKADKKGEYSVSDLQDECEKISIDVVIDFDQICIPNRMSEMAKTMYS